MVIDMLVILLISEIISVISSSVVLSVNRHALKDDKERKDSNNKAIILISGVISNQFIISLRHISKENSD